MGVEPTLTLPPQSHYSDGTRKGNWTQSRVRITNPYKPMGAVSVFTEENYSTNRLDCSMPLAEDSIRHKTIIRRDSNPTQEQGLEPKFTLAGQQGTWTLIKMVHHHYCVGVNSTLREMEGINSNRFRGCQYIEVVEKSNKCPTQTNVSSLK